MANIILPDEVIEHQKRVTILCADFSLVLKLNTAERKKLILAAAKHDIGKSMIEPALLSKPGKLSASEFNTIKKHAIYGAIILIEDNVDYAVVEAVLHHHESYSGAGYPLNLKGTKIPYLSRIIKLCDVYDALTYARSYRPIAYSKEETLKIMDSMAEEFDPELYKTFTYFINSVNSSKYNSLYTA